MAVERSGYVPIDRDVTDADRSSDLEESRPRRPGDSTRKGGRTDSGSAVGGERARHDATARVRIRDAALKHFAEEGYERTTIRAIARTAGVSHGMLRHHYGSKDELRAGCDYYVFRVLHRLNSLFLDIPSRGDPSLRSPTPIWRYAARSLVDGFPTAAPIFDEIVVMTTRRLARAGDAGPIRSDHQNRLRAALLAAMAGAIPLFQEHLFRTLGVDILSPEGDALVMLTLHDMFAPTDHVDDVSPAISTTRTVEVT
jgi:TetR/AcrR family transcriptional regulator, regulator of cefoperazone and chloramphenicol sensitivity